MRNSRLTMGVGEAKAAVLPHSQIVAFSPSVSSQWGECEVAMVLPWPWPLGPGYGVPYLTDGGIGPVPSPSLGVFSLRSSFLMVTLLFLPVALLFLVLTLLSFKPLHILTPVPLSFILHLLATEGGSPAFPSLLHPCLY